MNLPLYIYPPSGGLVAERRVNFDQKLFDKILRAAELEHSDGVELKIFSSLWSPLCSILQIPISAGSSIDFPFIPFPASSRTISVLRAVWQYAAPPAPDGRSCNQVVALSLPTGEAADGEDCVVDKPPLEPQPGGTGRVYVNGKGTEGQYFEGVPSV